MARQPTIKNGELVKRNGNTVLPYMDPQFNPDHPLNHLPPIVEDPALPLNKRERERLSRERFQTAMNSYVPNHVLRSWENDDFRKERREHILRLVLPPKMSNGFDDLNPKTASPSGNPLDPELDFRRFAVMPLHLGYNRFHAFGTEPGEDEILEDPDDICWIMEYTFRECNTIRRKIAFALGEFPAVIDQNNSLYDPELAWRYDRRLYCRCRRRNTYCIRPSHIEIFTSSFEILP